MTGTAAPYEGPLLLALDGGTQSTKVMLVDAAGGVHARAQVPLAPLDRVEPGHAEHPDDDLWDTLVEGVRLVVADWEDAGGTVTQVAALGLCSIRCCRAVLDADGVLLAPVLSWMDERTWKPWADRQRDDLTDERVATVCAASGYLTARLTGERVDAAAAYDQVWLSANELPEELLPPTVAAGEVLGALTATAAATLGLDQGLPVVATGNDKAVEALGAGLVEEADEVLLSLGTYVAAMSAVRQGSDRQRLATAGAATWLNEACPEGTALAETGGVRHGMGTVSWSAEVLEGTLTSLSEAAADVPAGCGGLVAVPDWLAPPGEPWRRGALVGLEASHTAAAVWRAVAEGLLLTVADHVRATERDLGHRFGTLVLTGGGSRSHLLTSIVAASLDRPVVRLAEADAAGLGAAVCAAVGAGLHPTWADAVASMVHRAEVVPPDPALVAAYAAIAPRHRRIRHGLADLLRDVGDLTSPASVRPQDAGVSRSSTGR